MHEDNHLFLFGYSLGFLLLLSLARGLYVFLRKGNPCDVVFVVGCTISLGILWNHGPELIDTTLNRINTTTMANYPLPSLAQNQFHQSLHVVDMHADSLLWTHRNLLQRSTAGHVDMVRLLEGNVAIQAFTIVTKSPQRMNFHTNTNTTDSIFMLGLVQQWSPALLFKGGQKLINRAIYQCQQLKRFVKASHKQLHLITSKHDLQQYLSYRSTHPNITAGFLGIEGMHALEGKLQNVDVLYDHGVRMMSPVHFFDNRLGGSAHGEEKYGLTAFGKQVIRKMENKSMLLDVAHSSIALLDDILLFAEVSGGGGGVVKERGGVVVGW
jgi:membrane dipeptidase